MSFWDLTDGSNAADNKQTEYEIPGGGNLDPIPDGSSVLAMIDEAKWDSKDDAEFVSLRWTVLSPDEYKNRKVFHKLWVTDDDPGAKDADKAAKKRDKARRMLAAIDANAGGKLTAKEGKPTDESLTGCLTNKPMIIRVAVWSIKSRETGEDISGNWVQAVAPKSAGIDVKEAAPKKSSDAASSVGYGGGGSDMDDQIPF